MSIVFTYILPYLIGSIPFGLLITRAAGLEDIRTIGSGNIGATNVLRTGKKYLALLTLCLDMLKGIIAVRLAKDMAGSVDAGYLAGLMAVVGHMFPAWLKFKGGKGVATIFGVLIAFSPLLAALTAGVWLFVFVVSRYSSLAALVSVPLSPAIAWALDVTETVEQSAVLALMATLMALRHKQNILNLLDGKEHKFGKKQAGQ